MKKSLSINDSVIRAGVEGLRRASVDLNDEEEEDDSEWLGESII